MSALLMITDDLRHAERLAREFDTPTSCRIHDLYADGGPNGQPSLIVSDVKILTSDALVRLRRCLDGLSREGISHILLVHGNPARAEVQARLLGAEPVPAAKAAKRVSLRLQKLAAARHEPTLVAVKHSREAEQFLKTAFFSGEPVSLALAEVGTDIVAQAVRETGIADWVRAVQQFDDVTHQHILLVAGLSAAFASALGLNAVDRHHLAKAALLHDVGKTQIPPAILNKPGRLDPDELRIMHSHAALGHGMLVGSGYDPATLAVVRSHHEMLDGSGYPDGLKAAQIPDLVRLVTISDIYAALIERRPYKPAMSGSEAMTILANMAGRLDPDLVRIFRSVAAAFEETPPSAMTGATFAPKHARWDRTPRPQR